MKTLLSLVLMAVTAAGAQDPRRVLVVYKLNSADLNGNGTGDSQELANYYVQKRGVPKANMLGLSVSTTASRYAAGKYAAFYSDMVVPIQKKLGSLGATNIDIILLAGEFPNAFYDGTVKDRSIDNALMGLNGLGSSATFSVSRASNPYFQPAPGFAADLGRFDHAKYKHSGTDMYLVTRMGGASGLQGIDQLDQSLYAERYLHPSPGHYMGNVYVDSKNGTPGASWVKYTDSFLSAQSAVQTGDYRSLVTADMNIAYIEHFAAASGLPVKWENTTSAKSIGDAGAAFSDLTSALLAPRALFYGGWYNFGKYNDVFQWLPGSIAIDLNSAPTFGTRALQRGVSAASYVVNEPFVNGHPRPGNLLYFILKGYTFAEASALATPTIGWMAVNEGDPLYAPMLPKPPVMDRQAPVVAGLPTFRPDPASGGVIMTVVVDDRASPEVVTAVVEYGPAETYGSLASSAPEFRRVVLVPLPWARGSTNHYRIRLTDPVGNVTTTSDTTFTRLK